MGNFVVGIPSYGRPNMLKLCVQSILQSSVLPQEICIVDNGNWIDPATFSGTAVKVNVVKPAYNLGVAASWNLLHEMYQPADIIYMNDDILLEHNTLKDLTGCDSKFFMGMMQVHESYGGYSFDAKGWYYGAYSCFLQREELWKMIGEFDSMIWPAYYEDTDYTVRMRLAKAIKYLDVVPSFFKHGRHHQATLRLVDDKLPDFVEEFNVWNLKRLKIKWNFEIRPPGREQFVPTYPVPFNGEIPDELELYYRSGLLEERFLRLPDESLYDRLETIRKLAEGHRTITELGAGKGAASCALLAALPERLTSYDKNVSQHIHKLYQFKVKTNFSAMPYPAALEQTEMLFVHRPDLLKQFPKIQDQVSRLIVINGSAPDFLDRKTWGFSFENGLSILRRNP